MNFLTQKRHYCYGVSSVLCMNVRQRAGMHVSDKI